VAFLGFFKKGIEYSLEAVVGKAPLSWWKSSVVAGKGTSPGESITCTRGASRSSLVLPHRGRREGRLKTDWKIETLSCRPRREKARRDRESGSWSLRFGAWNADRAVKLIPRSVAPSRKGCCCRVGMYVSEGSSLLTEVFLVLTSITLWEGLLTRSVRCTCDLDPPAWAIECGG